MQPLLLKLCKSYGVSLSEVAIRYALNHPHIHTTIVGISSMDHVTTNLKAIELEIPDGLLEEIDKLVATTKAYHAYPQQHLVWCRGKRLNMANLCFSGLH